MKKVKIIQFRNGLSSNSIKEFQEFEQEIFANVTPFNYHKGNAAFLHKILPASESLPAANIIGHIYIRRDQSPSGSILGSNVPICVRLQGI